MTALATNDVHIFNGLTLHPFQVRIVGLFEGLTKKCVMTNVMNQMSYLHLHKFEDKCTCSASI